VACLVGAMLYVAFLYLRQATASIASGDPLRIIVSVDSSLQGTLETATTAATLVPTASFTQAASQTPTSVLSPTSLPTVQQPELLAKPRGKIVFTCTPEKFNQLCLMNADGSDQERLTNRQVNDYYPSLSPDGRSVVFVSNQTGQFEIYIFDIQLREELSITEGAGNLTAPEISPDDLWIVYASRRDGDSSIWLMRRDGSLPHPLTDSQWNEIDPTWSPDGAHITFAAVRGGFVELFVMNADGSDIQQATHDVQGIGGRSSWSTDGRRLVFYAGPRGDRDIYVVEVATGQTTRLTFGGNNTGPGFSPDGAWIVFSSSRDGDHEIYIMRADGSEVTQLTDNTYDDWQPRWGP